MLAYYLHIVGFLPSFLDKDVPNNFLIFSSDHFDCMSSIDSKSSMDSQYSILLILDKRKGKWPGMYSELNIIVSKDFAHYTPSTLSCPVASNVKKNPVEGFCILNQSCPSDPVKSVKVGPLFHFCSSALFALINITIVVSLLLLPSTLSFSLSVM